MTAVDIKEMERLRTLKAYEILDTPAEEDFDNLASLASQICKTPISYISLLTSNRQWLKSKVGLDLTETSRSVSFCQHMMQEEQAMEVKDTLQDARFQNHPYVTNAPYIRFYAGSPLINSSGHLLGTLCVMDMVPKQLTANQKKALNVLAKQAVVNMELRLKQKQLEQEQQQLRCTNQKLDEFVHMVSHDLKEPIMNIQSVVEWLQENIVAKDYTGLSSDLHLIKERAVAMEELVEGLLQYAVVQVKDLHKELVDVRLLVQGLLNEHSNNPNMQTHLAQNLPVFMTEKVLLQQVFANLISNAYKYHHTGKGHIWVEVEEAPAHYTFCVKDDGPGIPPQHRERVFGIFERLLRDSSKASGSGIGLATVKKIIEDKGGRIWIDSELGQGTTFFFTWPKEMSAA